MILPTSERTQPQIWSSLAACRFAVVVWPHAWDLFSIIFGASSLTSYPIAAVSGVGHVARMEGVAQDIGIMMTLKTKYRQVTSCFLQAHF
jgi:hypothetical protein